MKDSRNNELTKKVNVNGQNYFKTDKNSPNKDFYQISNRFLKSQNSFYRSNKNSDIAINELKKD